jgi:hypothetical protein
MTRHLKQSKADRAGDGSIRTKGYAALNKSQRFLFVWLMTLAGIWLLSIALSE